jgi:hypothetical protein
MVAAIMAEPTGVADFRGDALHVPWLREFTAVQPAALQRGQRNFDVKELAVLVDRRDLRGFGLENIFHERKETREKIERGCGFEPRIILGCRPEVTVLSLPSKEIV